MSLSELADVATLAVSIVAVLGVGWLVYVRIRRHRRVQEDYEVLCEKLKDTRNYYDNVLGKSITEFTQGQPKSHDQRVEVLISLLGQHLDCISSQLQVLQFIGLAIYFRQHDADEEVATLLANWKLRWPITRREQGG